MSLLLPPLDPPSSGGHPPSRSGSPPDGADHPAFLTNRLLPPLAVSLSTSPAVPAHFESPSLLAQPADLTSPMPSQTAVASAADDLPDPVAPPEGLQEVKIFHNSRVDKRKLVWQEILENQYIRFSSTGKCLLLHVVLPKRASPVRMVIELFAQRAAVSRRGPNDTNVMRVASTRTDIPNVSTLKVTEHMQVETDNFCSKWCYVIKAPDIRPNYHFFFVQIDTVTGQRFTGRTISFHSHNNGHVAIDGKRRKPKNDRALLAGQAQGQQDGQAAQSQGLQHQGSHTQAQPLDKSTFAGFKQEPFQAGGIPSASATGYGTGQTYFRMAYKGQHHQQQALSSTSPLGSSSTPSLSALSSSSSSISPSGSLSSISASASCPPSSSSSSASSSSSSSSSAISSSPPPMTIPPGHALPAPSSSSSSPSLSSSPSSTSTSGNLHSSTPIAASTCSVPSPRPSSPSSTFLLPHFSASTFSFTAPSPPTTSPSPFSNASSPTFAGFPPSISPLNFSASSSFAALSGSLQPRQVPGLDGRKFEPCVSPPVSFDGEHPLSSFPWGWPTSSLPLSPRGKGRPDSPISGPRTSSPALLAGMSPRSTLPSLSPTAAALLPSFIGAGSRRRAQATASMHTIGSQSVESLSDLGDPSSAADVSAAIRLNYPQPPSRTPSPGTADVFGGLSSLLPEPPGFWVTGERPFGGKRSERDRIAPSTPEKRPRST